MEKLETKQYLIIYGVILLISFTAGPYINVLNHQPVYSVNCSEYNIAWSNESSIQIFNESDTEVCGLENPLYIKNNEPDYLGVFDLT